MAASSLIPSSATYFRTSSVILTRSLPLIRPPGLPIYVARFPSAPFMEKKCGPHMGHQPSLKLRPTGPPSPRLPSSLKTYDVARRRDMILRPGKSCGQGRSLTTMTDSLHSCNSNPRKRLRLTRSPSSRSAGARMLSESIRATPSDVEARPLLLQSALPGIRRLFAEVISRMDEPRKSVRSRGWRAGQHGDFTARNVQVFARSSGEKFFELICRGD
jgi:hypothetical protein